MSLHVIVGAGPVGTATATLLAERGERVRVLSRRGGGPQHPAIERIAVDATNADRLANLTGGAAALYNCANPPYHQWLTAWPPMATALLTAAERSGAVLATASNLYGYGPVDAPITASTPLAATQPKLKLRAQMWLDALTAHQAGRLRATEVRASDYIEANSIFSIVLAKPLLAGKRAFVPAALDVPHSWTSITDVATTLITAAVTEQAWGCAWLVPTNPPLTVREISTRFASLARAQAPKLTSLPYVILWSGGVFSPTLRELRITNYQWTRPFVVDSTYTEQTFGIAPTPVDQALESIQPTT